MTDSHSNRGIRKGAGHIDYECRVGICGRCKVPLRQGSVSMEVQDSLTEGEKRDGVILACQAKSVGDLVVDA